MRLAEVWAVAASKPQAIDRAVFNGVGTRITRSLNAPMSALMAAHGLAKPDQLSYLWLEVDRIQQRSEIGRLAKSANQNCYRCEARDGKNDNASVSTVDIRRRESGNKETQ
jgi:hypothetical protein